MPTYEFRCPAGHDFEKFYRKISDAPAEVACPECGAVASRQLSAGAGLLFKGSGFYITDYGKDGKGARKPSEDGTPSADKKTDAASGSKPGEAASKSDGAAAKPAADSKSSGDASTKTGGKSGGTSGGSSGGKSGGAV